jgi:hypothetical protein
MSLSAINDRRPTEVATFRKANWGTIIQTFGAGGGIEPPRTKGPPDPKSRLPISARPRVLANGQCLAFPPRLAIADRF